ILITAGPTFEKIDPVRFIGNYSSGKMGYAVADEAARRGADVILVSGPVSVHSVEQGVTVVSVESAKQMLAECEKFFPDSDIAVMCAAVADYAPANTADKKIKREKQDIPVINLVKNPDIAATLGLRKKDGQTLVGFALETDNEQSNALEKLERKNLDLIALNSLRTPGAGFGTDTNVITLIDRKGEVTPLPLMTKPEAASALWDYLTGIE
ncbi:MAG: phosphopantothenoylcysteine decarboxylase, partial [Paramuribaculum sp.]|nr:phosphopantothenoylcysteine decarboxylase [Paramuribaculum sp.]